MRKVIAYFDMDPSQTKRACNYNIDNVIQWPMQQKLCQYPQGCLSYSILLIKTSNWYNMKAMRDSLKILSPLNRRDRRLLILISNFYANIIFDINNCCLNIRMQIWPYWLSCKYSFFASFNSPFSVTLYKKKKFYLQDSQYIKKLIFVNMMEVIMVKFI